MQLRRIRSSAAIGAAVLACLAAAPAWAQSTRLLDPIPEPIPQGDVTVGLETVADGLVAPVTGVAPRHDKKHLYVVEQLGRIWEVDVARRERRGSREPKRLFGDFRTIVLPLGCFGINYDERGMFGLAFHPNYRKNGLIYTYTSETPAGQATLPPNQCDSRVPDHENVVREWHVAHPNSRGATVDPRSSREILRMQHPQFNHNGGELRFGPDGLLYVTVGDGGNADDQGPGHAPGGNAQDLSTLLGKVLRIDPRAGKRTPGYAIPRGNPFTGGGARREIWAYGFRNPYKASFDRRTGDLYVADVGQNDIEEVDLIQRGGNFGWARKEGTFAFDPNGDDEGFVTGASVPGNFVDPIAEYDHCLGPADPIEGCAAREGVAVVGGFVYRGKRVKALRGHYVFGDYSRDFFTSDGRLFFLDDDRRVTELRLDTGGPLGRSLLGIGEDGRGELYAMGKTGAVPGDTGIVDPANTTGTVMRIVPAHR